MGRVSIEAREQGSAGLRIPVGAIRDSISNTAENSR